ncbi:hypothetical protein COHA_009518 [Chlorella ohadii]|uniref:Uncharacterized protein n=1 Tax=Chlorella ohadii TaxID=2649997 RepID=A0AAD5DHR2_9CHLO|nr:hypothetical protein COHA_009518 [Chlorella ohadii]
MPDPGPFCEGDGWTPVDPSDLPEQLLRLTMEHGWGYLGELYGVYGRWRNCSHFSELQLAAEGCRNVRVAVGSGGLRQCYLLSPCSVEGSTWWLSMNETCPLQEEGWVFVEAIVAWEGSSPPTQELRLEVALSGAESFKQEEPEVYSEPNLPCGGPGEQCCYHDFEWTGNVTCGAGLACVACPDWGRPICQPCGESQPLFARGLGVQGVVRCLSVQC